MSNNSSDSTRRDIYFHQYETEVSNLFYFFFILLFQLKHIRVYLPSNPYVHCQMGNLFLFYPIYHPNVTSQNLIIKFEIKVHTYAEILDI